MSVCLFLTFVRFENIETGNKKGTTKNVQMDKLLFFSDSLLFVIILFLLDRSQDRELWTKPGSIILLIFNEIS